MILLVLPVLLCPVACPLYKERSCNRSLLGHIPPWKNNFPLLLIQEELVASYWPKNGCLILVNCLRKACPGMVK